ncbi:MAG: winged helix-turn-helix domain-containing protein, partial [Chloroflexia bacterium]|nr:winged helix-turn-helix domain-containing protein [Chloroflexia bacterium]
MAHLALALLGPARIARGDEPVTTLGAGKALALLAYLAVTPDRPRPRESLAALLWPEQPEENARHSLRQALTTLRKAIGDPAAPPHLLVTRDAVTFNGASDYQLDSAEFGRLLEVCREHPHRHPDACAACAERLERATRLVRGEFLAGVVLDESEELEEWLRAWRDRLQRQTLAALTLLVA